MMEGMRIRHACLAAGAALAGCGLLETPLDEYLVARLANPAIREASGLACDDRTGGYWLLNDGGSPPELFRLAADGADRGSLPVPDVGNTDWEDLAIYRSPGGLRAVIADIGDNGGTRSHVALHVVDLDDDDALRVERSVRFRYPDGPRDAESLAVDSTAGKAYVLSKRTVPAELYEVSLDADADAIETAVLIGTLETLPQPSDLDRRLAPVRQSWHWQPTAMDFSANGRLAAVLTYSAVYVYERRSGQSWQAAFQASPRRFDLDGVLQPEALCLSDGQVAVTTESHPAPLYRLPLDDERWERL